MPIRQLPPLLVNQIAAGEVIERPASVVKELLENSLDAGATRVDIAVEEGGTRLIRVSDDGGGIPPGELPLAVAPHATSKLAGPDDLAAIATLGFRGEALASIASVSRLRITSRATADGRPAEAAASLEASGDDVSPVRPAAGSPGTVIEVRDLFFNTPARRKFLRSAPSEFGHIAEVVGRIAMVRPEVGITLSHQGRKTLDAPPGQTRRERCLAVLGREMDEALLEFEAELPPVLTAPAADGSDSPATGGAGHVRVWGLAGLPAVARSSAKFQYLAVNGRPVRDRNLAHAVKEAYRGLIPPDKQPVAVVLLEIDPAAVDVNVHPAKAEVRFREPSRVHGLVLAGLRRRLLAADLTPSATLAPGAPVLLVRPAAWAGGASDAEEAGEDAPSAAGGMSAPAPDRAESARAFVDYFRRMDPRQKGFVYAQVKAAVEGDPAAGVGPVSPASPATSHADHAPAADPLLTPLRSRGVLQVHQSYLVTQDDQGLLIVDQHALHERVMFEELRARIAGQNLESQRLLMPAVVPASPGRQALLEGLAPLLARIGVEAEPFGPDAVAVHAFASFLFERGVDPVAFMTDLLDRAEEGGLEPAADKTAADGDEAVLHEVLDMMACKAAVKAGDRMTPEELAALLAKREEIERSSNCPHGRPTTLRLTLRDLEKQFKRS